MSTRACVLGRPRVFVEPYAGSAAVSLALLSSGKAPKLATYLGSKARWADSVLGAMGLAPGVGADVVQINDAGEVANTWAVIVDHGQRMEMMRWLRAARGDAETLWRRLAEEDVPADPAVRAAVWLCLQAGVQLGKPVDTMGGRWKTAGFSRLSPSAVRRGFTARFKPALLADRVAAVGQVLNTTAAVVRHGSAETLPVVKGSGVVVYVDPPYYSAQGKARTGYSQQSGESATASVVRAWADDGAFVGVSEGRPYTGVPGGVPVQVVAKSDKRPAHSTIEYVTMFGPR